MENNFEFSNVERALVNYASQKYIPLYGGFELTPYCNLSCKMCYVHETKAGLPILSGEKWLEIGRQAAAAGTLCIVLTGGEPMMHPDFKEIYLGLKKLGMVLTLNTNATLIDEDMADFLGENIPRRVNVSLYGPNENVYQQLCGNASGFSKTIHAIELMLERNIPVKINIVPNKINYLYLDEMLDICKHYGLVVEISSYLFEPIRKLQPNKQLYRLAPEDMAKALIKKDYYQYTEHEMMARGVMCYQGLEKFDISRQIDGTSPLQCRAGRSSFWICWDGKMNACVNMIRPQADVLEIGFNKAWELTKKEGADILVPAKCNTCSLRQFCQKCAAISFHQYGDFNRVPEIMCDTTFYYAKLLSEKIQRIEKD